MSKTLYIHATNLSFIHWIVQLGIITIFLTNTRPHFVSKCFTLVCKYLGVKGLRVRLQYLQASGQAEWIGQPLSPFSNTTLKERNENKICMCGLSYLNAVRKSTDRKRRYHTVWYQAVIKQGHCSIMQHFPQWKLRRHWIRNRCAVKSKLVQQRFEAKSTRTCVRVKHDTSPSKTAECAGLHQSKPISMYSSINGH